jgi:hypothetical protein
MMAAVSNFRDNFLKDDEVQVSLMTIPENT